MARSREQSAASGNGAAHDGGRVSPAARRLLWIVAYYAVAAGVGVALWRSSQAFRDLVESDSLHVSAEPPSRTDLLAGTGSIGSAAARPGLSTLLALLGSLATALPLAWVYSLTRRKRGFDQAMVHTIILLPVAVAGMVVLIQHSLPLAFSLAGIVALLRFRNTLDDTKDGVYVFVATTVGISAAVGALVVGVVTSVVFNVIVLALWWIDFAREPTPGIRGGVRRLARLPAPPAPRSRGNGAAADASNGDGDALRSRAERARERTLSFTAEHRAIDPHGRFNTTLRVHTTDIAAAQPIVERVLSERSRRWELVGVTPGADARVVLRYLVHVRHGERGDLLNAVREHGAGQVVGAEFR